MRGAQLWQFLSGVNTSKPPSIKQHVWLGFQRTAEKCPWVCRHQSMAVYLLCTASSVSTFPDQVHYSSVAFLCTLCVCVVALVCVCTKVEIWQVRAVMILIFPVLVSNTLTATDKDTFTLRARAAFSMNLIVTLGSKSFSFFFFVLLCVCVCVFVQAYPKLYLLEDPG